MNDYSNPKSYWQSRLRSAFDLTGVGHAELGRRFNEVLYQERRRTLLRALGKTGLSLRGKRLLELGPGSGFYAALARDQGVSRYHGVDITDVSVEQLSRAFPDFTFTQADVGERPLKFGTEAFDFVLTADVLFHVVEEDRFEQALKNISANLVTGGTWIVSDILSSRAAQPTAHCRFRSFNDYITAAERSGFRMIHLEPVFAILHPPTGFEGESLSWKATGEVWNLVKPLLGRVQALDLIVSELFRQVDRRVLLPRAGVETPNTKWLIFQKHR